MPPSIILNWSQFKKHVFVARWTKYDEIFPHISVSELTTWHAMTSRNASCRMTNCFPRNYTTHHWGFSVLWKTYFCLKIENFKRKKKGWTISAETAFATGHNCYLSWSAKILRESNHKLLFLDCFLCHKTNIS